MKIIEHTSGSSLISRQKKVDEYNFPYTANFYMGCPFRCKYCYTQQFPFSQHVKFGDEIKVKMDAPEKLRKGLAMLDTKEPPERKVIQIGNTWDIYQPLERKYRITRQCLETLLNFPAWTVHLETRSPIILDDIDLLRKMPKLEVEITMAVIKDFRKFEPHGPSVDERLETIRALSEAGIFVRTMIMPIIPGYTDVDEIIAITKKAGAQAFKQKKLNYTTVDKMLA